MSMGVYINGMEMPQEKKITLTIFPDGRVYENREERLRGHGKDCIPWKAVPVPPHGRLIEKNAVFELIRSFPNVDRQLPVEFMKALYELPTIIPASEDGVKTEEDSEPWLCLSCRHYPPSSTDGKPCSQCNPSEVFHSCYDPASEEGE